MTATSDKIEEKTEQRIVTWRPFFEALKEKGLLNDPDHTYRITIDAKVGELITITYYTYADGRFIDALGAVREATPEEIERGEVIVT